jgi:membrane dipeptidase
VIIDGHNDLVLHRWRGEPTMHLDLDDARAAGFAGGFFALYVPSPRVPDPSETPYALPLPEPIPFDEATAVAEELFATLCALPVRRAVIADDFQPGEITAIVHMEGAEPIARDLSNLESWYERGLRSIGFVWSRPNAFAEGVPFRFPSPPDTGPGLTDAGRELVRACNRLGILVDLSHLNERGFRDVAELSTAPLVATHSNAHAICPASRNLTDEQLDAIRDSGGIVGVNFAVTFLRADGQQRPAETGLDAIVRHVDHLAERMGVDHVAFRVGLRRRRRARRARRRRRAPATSGSVARGGVWRRGGCEDHARELAARPARDLALVRPACEEAARLHRHHDRAVLVDDLVRREHRSSARVRRGGADVGHRRAPSQLIAGPHRSEPPELLDARRAE